MAAMKSRVLAVHSSSNSPDDGHFGIADVKAEVNCHLCKRTTVVDAVLSRLSTNLVFESSHLCPLKEFARLFPQNF